jgi:curved DNA-binding protein CbpA
MSSVLISKVVNAKNYFERLQLSTQATDPSVVKKAFKKLALQVHPDKCNDDRAEEAFKMLAEAYECLVDPKEQSLYLQKMKSTNSNVFFTTTPDANKRYRYTEEAVWEAMSKKRKKAQHETTPKSKPSYPKPQQEPKKTKKYYGFSYDSDRPSTENQTDQSSSPTDGDGDDSHPVSCSVCKRRFTNQAALERHWRFADLNHKHPFGKQQQHSDTEDIFV